jgi:hypothetical protein
LTLALLLSGFAFFGAATETSAEEARKHPSIEGVCPHLVPQPRIPDSLGVNIHFKEECKDLDLIAEAGWKFIRMDLWWIGVEEEKGVYNFEKPGYDELTEACAKRGIRIIYILCYENPLYTSSRSIRTEEERKAFAAFAAATVKNYKGKGIIWEIWNEPNIKGFWKPEPNVDEYMALVKEAVPRIREADPDAFICAPATSGIRFPWLEECFKRGLLNLVDAVSVHPYREQIPETAIQDFDKLYEMMDQYGSSGKRIPVISSEWGYSVINWDRRILGQYDQASRLIRQSIVNLYKNVPITIWYDWKDDGKDPEYHEHHFGTVLPDLTPKVAYKAISVFSKIFDGYTVAKRLDMNNEEHFVFELTKGERKAYAFWTIGDEASMTIPLPVGNGKLVTMTGEYDLISWPEKGLNIHVSDQPQYLFLQLAAPAQMYEPVIPKTPYPVQEVYVLDFGLEKAKGDSASIVVMPTITAFQGLINRGSSTKIFLDKAPLSLVNYPELSYHELNVPDGGNIGPGNPFQYQLDEGLVVEDQANIHCVSLNSEDAHPVLDWMLANYGHKLKGLVRTPDEVNLGDWAGARAAAYNACTFESDETTGYLLPAHSTIINYINSKLSPDLPITYDLSGMSNIEAFDWSMYTKDYINHPLRDRTAISIAGSGIHFAECMVDYAVSTYCYSFFLDPRDSLQQPKCTELFTLTHFDAGALIIGEGEIIQILSTGGAGGYFTASNTCIPNCSVTSSIPIDRTDFQPAPTPQASAIDNNGLYISFNAADGDGLSWNFVQYKAMRTASDPYVNSVPMGYRVCPYLIDLFPTMFEWFTKQYRGNNDIVPSPWDGGFPSQPEGRAAGTAMHEHYINTCNGAIQIWNTFHDFAHAAPDDYHSYTSSLDMHSVILGYDGAEGGDVLRWDIRDGRVYCNMVGRHRDTTSETVTKIKNALAVDAVAGEPAFVMVRSNTEAGYHAWTHAKEILDLLEADPEITRTIYPLTPRDQAQTYKVWKTGGSDTH